jgi:antitoxin component of MazEF toxin-antitoxin module
MPTKENRVVKLQRRFAYRYKDKDHFKHMLTVPEHVIDELGWEEGQYLNLHVKGNKLVLERQEAIQEEMRQEEQEEQYDENEQYIESWDHTESRPLKGILMWCHKWLDKGKDEKPDAW